MARTVLRDRTPDGLSEPVEIEFARHALPALPLLLLLLGTLRPDAAAMRAPACTGRPCSGPQRVPLRAHQAAGHIARGRQQDEVVR